MNFENFTKHLKAYLGYAARLSCLPALFLLTYGVASAQCPLGCNNNVQVSLDADCQVEVTPAMILEGEGDNCDYTVVVYGPNNQPLPSSPVVNRDHIGKRLKVEVFLDGTNSCWGHINVEDKLPPSFDNCVEEEYLECYESGLPVVAPTATDNCDPNPVVNVVSDITTDLPCTDQYSAQRVIVYQAEDDQGNLSQYCTRTIYYTRIGLGDITFPRNYDNLDFPSLSCQTNQWDDNGNDYPDVAEVGAPTTPNGAPIYPNNSLCELNATFSDDVLDICESSYKVLRKWTVMDWCTSEIEERYQIIKVEDNEGPIVTCPTGLIEVPADPYNCSGDWVVEAPTVIFDCSGYDYEVSYLSSIDGVNPDPNGLYITDNVVRLNNGTYVIQDLPVGLSWIKYTITDNCGNPTECFSEVNVVDNVPPVPVCDQNTTVTLTTQGVAIVKAESFDDGSHDNCSPVTFEVARMTSGCGVSANRFGPTVEFCCTDVNNDNLQVILRVYDSNGNSNTCMVNVDVQDKINPVIDCPDDVTLYCGDDINDLSVTGEAVPYDNCGGVTANYKDLNSVNQCGITEPNQPIRRRWEVSQNGTVVANCTQFIYVYNPDPFVRGDIRWPRDRDLVGCQDSDLDVSETGEPTWDDNACNLVAYTFNDQIFEFVDSSCFKILRTFTVIDWCTFDQANPGAGGIWQQTQIIKLNNTVKPTINNCGTVNVCAYGANCDEPVSLVLDASDDCTDDLVYKWSLDIDDDGSVNATGSTNDASRTLPVGTHRIHWTVEDMCGNVETCNYDIIVRDCKKPTPYCLSEITTVIMPSSGEIDIWASDYNLGSFDNCSEKSALRYSFSSNVNNTRALFTCDDLGINILQMWVTDEAGNQDYCEVKINIQSNDGCNGASPRVSGEIKTATSELVPSVMVALEEMAAHETQMFETQGNGKFAFSDVTQQDYQLTAERNDFHDNGVSTLDLVLIQRHILGLTKLETAEQVIAADINNSESISGADVVQLRKLVLGIYTEFPDNKSWKFVDAGQEFADETSPWPLREYINLSNDNSSPMTNKDFTAIKIGDVNNSATAGATSEDQVSDVRSAQRATFVLDGASYEAGEELTIPVLATEEMDVFGYQFTLSYDADAIEINDVLAGSHNMTSSNVNLLEAANGKVAVAFDNAYGVPTSATEPMFYIQATAKKAGNVNNVLGVSNDVARAELYTADMKTMKLELATRTETGAHFTLLQNTPNPFSTATNIDFILAEDANATLTVFDVAGRTLMQTTKSYNQGFNTITLSAEDFNGHGILYYQLESNGYKATKKMIVLNR